MKKQWIFGLLAGALLAAGAGLLARSAARTAPERPAAPPAVPEGAVLKSFAWTRSSSSADESFWFNLGPAQGDAEAAGSFLNCEFHEADGRFVARQDAPLTGEQWAALSETLRPLALPPYTPPEEQLLDGCEGEVTVTWVVDGETIRCRYADGKYEALYALLRALSMQSQSAGG